MNTENEANSLKIHEIISYEFNDNGDRDNDDFQSMNIDFKTLNNMERNQNHWILCFQKRMGLVIAIIIKLSSVNYNKTIHIFYQIKQKHFMP